MFRSHLLKLSATLVLLVATTFVSVTAVAADPWYPVKAGDAAFASDWDWVDRHPSSILSSDAAFASDWDWVDRHPSSTFSSDAAAASDWFERHPSSTLSGDTAGDLMRFGPPGR